MRRVALLLIVVLAALLAVEVFYSLAWPIAHDEAPLLYQAFLMLTEGRLPYRDLFDFQMPGAYAVFYALGALTRFDASALRVIDLLLLAGLSGLTYLWLRPFGWHSALAAMLLFAFEYLQGGPSMALQREFLLLLPIAFGLWRYLNGPPGVTGRLVLGFCFGLAALVKPHAAIGLLPFFALDLMAASPLERGRSLQALLATALGFLVPIAVAAVRMQALGTLAPFLQIALNYWPLYAQVNGQLVVTRGAAHWLELADQLWRMAGNGGWFLAAAVGWFLARRAAPGDAAHRRTVALMGGLVLAYAIYPALSGQFFQYHYLPFLYFAIALSSLCLTPLSPPRLQAFGLAAMLAAVLLGVRMSPVVISQIDGKPLSGGRADQIGAYLASHLKPGDTVQPLDWTGGALQAMLETRASLGTRFVFDFYLYHHVSTPYIRGLRTQFLREMRANPPDYVVEVTAMDKPWISGPDTNRVFSNLRDFLDHAYIVDVSDPDFTIYRKR